MARNSYSHRSFSVSTEEESIIKRIVEKHAPEDHKFEVMPIMEVIEDIFHHALFTSAMVPQEIHRSIKTSSGPTKRIELHETIRYTINRLSWEMICKCSKGLDAHSATLAIFDSLERFSWEVKVVLVLAAFAMSYGEFWLTVWPIAENPLSQSVSMFKQPPCLRGSALALKFRFEALASLIKIMFDLAYCLIQLKDYFAEFQSHTEVQIACYRIIKSAVSCQCFNMDLVKMGTEYTASATEIPELKTYTHDLQNILAFLNEQLEKLFVIEEEKAFSMTYEDVTLLIQKFFITKDSLVLWHGSRSGNKITISEVGLDVLKGRSVGLFISDFDFDVNMQEFNMLVETYKKIKESKNGKNFEIVWIPMVDQSIQWSEMKDITYDRAAMMPWYSFCYPTTIKTSFRFYIRESWHFQKKPILVLLDSRGNVTCTNAIPMVTIWGDSAYPFTSSREAALWKEMSWNVETMVKDIDPRIPAMIKQEKLVCFYGGDDLDWIRKFARTMTTIMKETGIQIELIYIGINGRREKLQKILAAFAQESISSCWSEVMIRSFWFRFQSVYNSRMQHCKSAAFMDDPVMKELMTISTYDASDHGWAMMFRGSHEIVKASGKQLMEFLERFQNWRVKVRKPADFVRVAKEDMTSNRGYVHCTHMVIPMSGLTGWFGPGKMNCLECGRTMERYYLYKCCIE